MLNGVGGRTIAEAKENMLHDEYLDWIAYRNKHGPLNLAKHVEWGNGLLAMLFNNVHYRDKKEHHEFMPHYEMPEATIGDVMKLLSGG